MGLALFTLCSTDNEMTVQTSDSSCALKHNRTASVSKGLSLLSQFLMPLLGISWAGYGECSR